MCIFEDLHFCRVGGIDVRSYLYELWLTCSTAGTQEQTCLAIGHLSRIVRVKSTLLSAPSKNRRVPK